MLRAYQAVALCTEGQAAVKPVKIAQLSLRDSLDSLLGNECALTFFSLS